MNSLTTCRNCQTRITPGESLCRKCGQVVFADENLEAEVRRELKKPLTRAAIRELTELDPFGTEIEYLLGLDSAVNLTRLNLGWNQISDVSPLASLTNLTELYLPNNPISDVSPWLHSRTWPCSTSATTRSATSAPWLHSPT